MRRIALCLLLAFAVPCLVPSLAMAQQNRDNTKENIEKSDKRANFGGKASQQRGGGGGGNNGGKQTGAGQGNKSQQ